MDYIFHWFWKILSYSIFKYYLGQNDIISWNGFQKHRHKEKENEKMWQNLDNHGIWVTGIWGF